VIPDSCRSNFQPFYLHPPHAPPSYAHCARRRPGRGFAAFPFGSTSVLGFAFPSQARQCIRPYRVHHFLNYGLVVRFRLLPTPPLGDAVAFCYGQPVLCPTGTFTPLLVRTLRRTRGAACSAWRRPRRLWSPQATPPQRNPKSQPLQLHREDCRESGNKWLKVLRA